MNDFQNNLGEPQNNTVQEPSNLNQVPNNLNNQQNSINQEPNNLNQMPNNINQNPSVSFEPKKSSGKGMLKAIIVVIIIAALVAGYFFLTIKKENAKETFEKSINKQLASIKEVLSEAKSLTALKKALQNQGTVSISAEFNTNIPNLESLENDKFNFEFGYSKEKELLALRALINDKIGNKLQGEFQTDGKVMTIKLDNIYDKIIKSNLENNINIKEMIEENFAENETAFSSEDLNYILTIIKDGFFESIEKEELIEEKITKKIIDKEIDLRKITYELTKENFIKIVTNIINKIKSDSKAIEITIKINSQDQTKEEIINELDNSLKYITENSSSMKFENVNFIVYINNKFELSALELSNSKFELFYENLEEKYAFAFKNKDEDQTEIKIELSNGDTKNINFSILDSEMNVYIDYEIIDTSTDNIYANNNNIKITFTEKDQPNNKMELGLNLKLKIEDKYDFSKLDSNLAIDAKNINELEQTKILNNLENNQIIKNSPFYIYFSLMKENFINKQKCAKATCSSTCSYGEQYCTYINEYGISESITCECEYDWDIDFN